MRYKNISPRLFKTMDTIKTGDVVMITPIRKFPCEMLIGFVKSKTEKKVGISINGNPQNLFNKFA